MATARMSVNWVDANGQQSLRTITADISAAAILAAASAYTNAQPQQTWEGQILGGYPTPTSGPYLSASQVAYLRFVDATGSVGTLALPGPLTSIFMADGVTVDPSTIAPLIAACIGTLICGSGNKAVAFSSGSLGPGKVNN